MKLHRFIATQLAGTLRDYRPGTTGCRVLFWTAIAMIALCSTSIGVAAAFMPNNIHGQKAVIGFYRWFGTGVVVWSAIAAWVYGGRIGHCITDGRD